MPNESVELIGLPLVHQGPQHDALGSIMKRAVAMGPPLGLRETPQLLKKRHRKWHGNPTGYLNLCCCKCCCFPWNCPSRIRNAFSVLKSTFNPFLPWTSPPTTFYYCILQTVQKRVVSTLLAQPTVTTSFQALVSWWNGSNPKPCL